MEKDTSFKEKYREAYNELTALLAKSDTSNSAAVNENSVTRENSANSPIFTGQGVVTRAPYELDTFISVFNVATLPPSYVLRDSTIYNSGVTDHISNNINNLVPGLFQPCNPISVYTGGQLMYIVGYGERHLRVTTSDGLGLFRLFNVALIPNFFTNCISRKRLRRRGYQWDEERNMVYLSGHVAFELHEHYDQDVVKYNDIAHVVLTALSTQPKPPCDADVRLWHFCCGHLGKEALEKLMSALYGVKIKGQFKIECQECF